MNVRNMFQYGSPGNFSLPFQTETRTCPRGTIYIWENKWLKWYSTWRAAESSESSAITVQASSSITRLSFGAHHPSSTSASAIQRRISWAGCANVTSRGQIRIEVLGNFEHSLNIGGDVIRKGTKSKDVFDAALQDELFFRRIIRIGARISRTTFQKNQKNSQQTLPGMSTKSKVMAANRLNANRVQLAPRPHYIVGSFGVCMLGSLWPLSVKPLKPQFPSRCITRTWWRIMDHRRLQ